MNQLRSGRRNAAFFHMKDLLLILGSLGFAAFLIMLTLGISASGVQFWVELFF